MNALFKLLITIFFVATLLWLCFANQASVAVVWSPLHEGTELPLAIIVVAATVLGFMWGGLIVWLNTAPLRRDRRRKAKELVRLEKELNAATLASQTPSPQPSSSSPLLT